MGVPPRTLPVSIVIPAWNRHRVLPLMFPEYLRQNCAEIVVVDDASRPPLVPLAGNARTRVQWIRLPRRSRQPAARMAGVRAATQPWILFGEDDAFPAAGCADNLLRYATAGTFDLVAPQLITTRLPPGDPALALEAAGAPAAAAEDVVDLRRIQFQAHRPPLVPIPVPWLHALTLSRREVVLRIGFREGTFVGNAYREETDFHVRAADSGLRLGFVPGPPMYHYKGPLNFGAAHELARLPLVEYSTLRNNYIFLRDNRDALARLGAHANPVAGTVSLAAGRVSWYVRRLAILLSGRRAHTASNL